MARIKLLARDIMIRNVTTVAAESRLADAVAVMDREGFSQLPVVRGNRLIGLLTEADVRRALMKNRQNRPVSELAGALPELVQPDTRIARTLQAMDDQEAILVVGPQQELQGIITYWDMIVLGRPHVMVKEVEQLLRMAVSNECVRRFGAEWWNRLPENLRERAEDEHRMYDGKAPADSEHMLGHTVFFGLIQIYHYLHPDVDDKYIEALDKIREFRNQISHLVALPPAEQAEMSRRCVEIGDWLTAQIPESLFAL